ARLVIDEIANDSGLLGGGGNSSWFVHVQAALQNVPRHRAIHRTGVHVGKSKSLCQGAGNATFAGSSRTIDGDDVVGGHGGLRRFFIGNRAEASSWSRAAVIPSASEGPPHGGWVTQSSLHTHHLLARSLTPNGIRGSG